MNPAAARTSAPPPVVFRDAFGERRRLVAPTGSDTLDVLCPLPRSNSPSASVSAGWPAFDIRISRTSGPSSA